MTEPSGLTAWLINPFGTRAVHIDTYKPPTLYPTPILIHSTHPS